MNRIQIALPKNFSPSDSKWFERRSYELRERKVSALGNVFVTHDGILLKNFCLVHESLHDYPKTKGTFHRRALRAYVSSQLGRAKHLSLDWEKRYLIIHHPWMNYYHWLLECFPRLFAVSEQLRSLTLLLPQSYRGISFVQDTISLFTFKEIEYVPSGHHLFVPHLVVPQLRAWGREYNPHEISSLRSLILSKTREEHSHTPTRRLFVTRKTAAKRTIRNESEILPVFEQHGFEVVDFSKMSVKEQAELCSESQILVAQHGAALSNAVFLPRGASVLELHKKPAMKEDFINDLYWHLSSVCGLSYYYLVCDGSEPETFFVNADIIVDPESLHETISKMVNELQS